jgi:hypothetical protein
LPSHQHVQVQVEVIQGEPGHLGAAGAGIQQQHQQRGIATGLEAAAGADREQALEGISGHDRDGLVGHDRRAQLRHRVGGDLLLLDQPGVQQLEHLVVGRRGAGGAATGKHVGHERLQVRAGGGLQGGTAGAQEDVGLAQADEVGLDRPFGAVEGAQVPLEGADERAWGELVHEPKR